MLTDDQKADFTSERIQGFIVATGQPMDVPLISHIHENLYMGGCPRASSHSDHFIGIIDLYARQRYNVHNKQKIVSWPLFDSDEPEHQPSIYELEVLCRVALLLLNKGPTLIHCQAGLNRSGLLTALVLRNYASLSAEDAIALIREKRSENCLCNKAFEQIVLNAPGF